MLSFGFGIVVGSVMTFVIVTWRTQREFRQLAHRTRALAERAARAAHDLRLSARPEHEHGLAAQDANAAELTDDDATDE